MGRAPRIILACAAAAVVAAIAGGLIGADALWPPDLARYVRHSTVVADRDHRILRAFTTPDYGRS